MLISVIVPVYNSEKTIRRCIESVIISLEKVTNDYEIICIDDGSTDDSLKLCNDLSSKNSHIVIIHQENTGVATARNRGLEIAKGEYIAFNDSDDEWTENHVQLLKQGLDSNKDYCCISGNHDINKQRVFKSLTKINDLYIISLKNQLLKNYFSPQATMIKRCVIDSGIRFENGMRYAEEGLFFNLTVKKFKSVFLNKKVSTSILGKYKFGDGGLSGNLKQMERGELYNIKYAYKNLGISFSFYFFAKTFSLLKYLRRIIIVKIREIRSH